MPGQYGPTNLDLLRRTTRADFNAQLGVSQAETIWNAVGMEFSSDSDQEVYAFFGGIPKPVRTDRRGGGISEERALNDFSLTVVNAHWKMRLPVHRDILEDAKLDQIRVRARSQADSAMGFLDERMTTVIETNGNSYDARPFFGANHDGGAGAAHDNDIAFDVTTPSNPTITEFEGAFTNGVETLRALEDDQNRKANHGELGLVAMVPPSMEYVARAVLEVGPVAGQTGNSGVWKGQAKVKANPYTAAANNERFYLFVASRPVRPVVYQKRKDWEYNLITEGDDWSKRDIAEMVTDGRFEFSGGDHKKAVRIVLT